MDHSLFLKDKGIYLSGNNYYYHSDKSKVTNTHEIVRLKSIKVPPSWNSIWYASNKKCHIQAYGIDSSGKKQYILNINWINSKKCEKFSRMKLFNKKIIHFKKLINRFTLDLTKENIIKVLLSLMLDTHIRVGNEIYSKNNKTYGLTTLLKKHLKVNDYYSFEFVGKSGIKHNIKINTRYNQILSLLLKNRNPQDNLFYYHQDNSKININSDDLNDYIKSNLGKEFTCKDFRTYSANILFIETFLKNSKGNDNIKKIIQKSIEEAALKLGHSKGISKKSYISDSLINYCLDSFDSAVKLSPLELFDKV